jgi:hypothetical protein
MSRLSVKLHITILLVIEQVIVISHHSGHCLAAMFVLCVRGLISFDQK